MDKETAKLEVEKIVKKFQSYPKEKLDSMPEEDNKISLKNQRNLKEIFDKINNKLREYGLSNDQRMHLTMAFLFLKLIKEDSKFKRKRNN